MGMSVDQAWDAYEAVERNYLQALIDEAPKDALIGAAGKARDTATTLQHRRISRCSNGRAG